jgi:hypothetical protein
MGDGIFEKFRPVFSARKRSPWRAEGIQSGKAGPKVILDSKLRRIMTLRDKPDFALTQQFFF